jgi:hypothetical protein
VNETSGRAPLGDYVGTDQENDEPACRLDIGEITKTVPIAIANPNSES